VSDKPIRPLRCWGIAQDDLMLHYLENTAWRARQAAAVDTGLPWDELRSKYGYRVVRAVLSAQEPGK
jgi:hypothetical protein